MTECGHISATCQEHRCIKRPGHTGPHIYAANGVSLVQEGDHFLISSGGQVLATLREREL